MSHRPTALQRPLLEAPTKPHRCVIGAKGSGKSANLIRGWAWHITSCYAGHEHAALAKRKVQLEGVVLRELSSFSAEIGVPLQRGRRGGGLVEWRLGSLAGDEPNLIRGVVFGEANADSVAGSLQGLNLATLYCDEAPNLSELVRAEACSRLRSVRFPTGWWSGNPDHPSHHFRVDFRSLPDVEEIILPLHPHDGIPADYAARLEATMPHQWQRDRYIHSLDAAASGLVYPRFADRVADVDAEWTELRAGVDWAAKTVSHAVLLGRHDAGWHVIDEWRHDAETDGEMDEEQQAAAMIAQFDRWGRVGHWTVDQTSKGIRLALRQQTDAIVRDSGLPIHDGIAKVSALLNSGRLTVAWRCVDLRDEAVGYGYPPSARGAPAPTRLVPVQVHNHGLDALRYAIEWLPDYRMPMRTPRIAA